MDLLDASFPLCVLSRGISSRVGSWGRLVGKTQNERSKGSQSINYVIASINHDDQQQQQQEHFARVL